jgi:hypothetical protein
MAPPNDKKDDDHTEGRGETGKVEEAQIVPVKKIRMEEQSTDQKPAMPPTKPQLPTSTSDDSSINMGNVVKYIIPYVLQHLPAVLASGTLFADMPLHLQQPLDIKTKSQTSELVSYKDRWTTANAVTASTMYEATGSLFWCNPFPASEVEEVLARDPVLWSQVREVADGHFKVACKAPAETRGKALAETRGKDMTRIVFPISLPVHVEEVGFIKTQLRSTLHVVSGHVYFYDWYLAMYEALDAGSTLDVLSLWQCCLMATLHVRVGMSLTDLAVFSIQQSEHRKTMDTMPCMMCLDGSVMMIRVCARVFCHVFAVCLQSVCAMRLPCCCHVFTMLCDRSASTLTPSLPSP